MHAPVRLLLLGDTHVGFDHPSRPRVERRRRGPDFLACYDRALEPARRGEIDLVVHGGDLLHHSRVPSHLVLAATRPLVEVASLGIPVFLVPGNHERSRIPFPILTAVPGVHVFDRPRTVGVHLRGLRVAVAGFPFQRRVDHAAIAAAVAATGCRELDADISLLCMHQTVEGARVGVRPREHVFRSGRDIIAGAAIPAGFAAVLSGHIHRSQVLRSDLKGGPLAAPVVYAGSVERTGFQEREEVKGVRILELEPGPGGGRLTGMTILELPARPMFVVEVPARCTTQPALERHLSGELAALPADSVVRVDPPAGSTAVAISDRYLRELAPPTMNVSVVHRAAR